MLLSRNPALFRFLPSALLNPVLALAAAAELLSVLSACLVASY